MIPAPPGAIACPDCGHLHEDPRYQSYISFGTSLYSDLHRKVMSMAVDRPRFVTCRACGKVNFLADYRESRHPGSPGIARWVAATLEQAFAALANAQPPFLPGSNYAHSLRLDLWRQESSILAAGVLVDQRRRDQLLQKLLEECCERASTPTYQYLLGEIERQGGDFEVAAQRFRNLVELKDDAVLAWFSRRNLEWCLEGRVLRQQLDAPPKAKTEPASTKRSRVYKLVMAVSDCEVHQTISRWVNFPNGIMSIDLQYLPSATSVADPLGGIVLLASDVLKTWPGEDGVRTFIEAATRLSRAVPFLILGDALPETRALVAALRNSGFHASSFEPKHLDRLRFEDWVLHGQL